MIKTITITLNEEQERLLLARIKESTWRLWDKERTHLSRNYKNPSAWTKERVNEAKKNQARLQEEHKQMRVVIDEIKKQLGVIDD